MLSSFWQLKAGRKLWRRMKTQNQNMIMHEIPDPMDSIVRLGERFRSPLKAAGADLDELRSEFR